MELTVCPYCYKQYKRITERHLAKHNIQYMKYLEKYEYERYYEKVISDFFWKFYRPNKYKFIEQVYSYDTKGFIWVTKYTMDKKELINDKASIESNQLSQPVIINKKRKFPLSNNDFVQHLRLERTIGIYSYTKDTTFLTFDIDEDNMKYVQIINSTLRNYGIEENQILISYSGNKGYHITIFFNAPILKIIAKKLFDLILWSAELETCKRDNGANVIEAMGVTNQGVKLPLSLNRKNTRMKKDSNSLAKEEKENFCFLINRYGRQHYTLYKIESMLKIETKKVNDIIDKIEVKKALCNKNVLSVNETVHFNKRNLFEETSALLNEPIQAKQRHRTLLKIAIYNKSIGLISDENERILINYVSNPNIKHQCDTSICESVREIKSIIKTIYNSDKYKFCLGLEGLSFTKDEIVEILSVNDKHLRKFYFIMFIQYKMFADKKSGEFFMTYESFKNAINLNGKVINKNLLKLEELGKIQFIRKGVRNYKADKIQNLPNIYKLKNDCFSENEEIQYRLLKLEKEDSSDITFVNFEMMCAKVLSKTEIKRYFSQPKEILKFKYQKLVEI